MIFDKVKLEQLQARKDGDTLKAKLLTTLIGEADPFGRGEVTDDQITQKLNKFRKNIDESMKAYAERGVDYTDLVQEKTIIMSFLPRQMSETEMNDWIEINMHPDSTIRDAMVGINKYAKEHDLLVDKKTFAKMVGNR